MIENPDAIPVPGCISHYRILDTLGYGAFSVVRAAVDSRTERTVAIKIVPRARIAGDGLMARFEMEIRVLQQMRHPNVVQLIDVLSDELNFYIVMEFCGGGELFQYIIDRGKLDESQARGFFRQLVDALRSVHALGVVHRDVKPENLLLDDYGAIKVTDFGLSRYVGAARLAQTACGSPCYASPEILSGGEYDGTKSDMWSCGVILFAMVAGHLPWTKKNQTALFEQIKRGEYRIPVFVSDGCRNLIAQLLAVDPAARPTAAQALEHPWVGEVSGPCRSVSVPAVSLGRIDAFFRQPSDPRFPGEPELMTATPRGTGFAETGRLLSSHAVKLPAIRDARGPTPPRAPTHPARCAADSVVPLAALRMSRFRYSNVGGLAVLKQRSRRK